MELPADRAVVDALLAVCSEEEVDDAEIYEDQPDEVVYGAFHDERLVAYAGFRRWGERIADIGILTHPEYRQRGIGKAAVSRLTEWCLANDVVPMYRVDPEHFRSRKIAEALGYHCVIRIDVLKFVDQAD